MKLSHIITTLWVFFIVILASGFARYGSIGELGSSLYAKGVIYEKDAGDYYDVVMRDEMASTIVNWFVKNNIDMSSEQVDCKYWDLVQAEILYRDNINKWCNNWLLTKRRRFYPRARATQWDAITMLARGHEDDSSIQKEDAYRILKELSVIDESFVQNQNQGFTKYRLYDLLYRNEKIIKDQIVEITTTDSEEIDTDKIKQGLSDRSLIEDNPILKSNSEERKIAEGIDFNWETWEEFMDFMSYKQVNWINESIAYKTEQWLLLEKYKSNTQRIQKFYLEKKLTLLTKVDLKNNTTIEIYSIKNDVTRGCSIDWNPCIGVVTNGKTENQIIISEDLSLMWNTQLIVEWNYLYYIQNMWWFDEISTPSVTKVYFNSLLENIWSTSQILTLYSSQNLTNYITLWFTKTNWDTLENIWYKLDVTFDQELGYDHRQLFWILEESRYKINTLYPIIISEPVNILYSTRTLLEDIDIKKWITIDNNKSIDDLQTMLQQKLILK